MTPGNSQILTCPFCGKEKEIMSLISGNTYGAEIWSDGKQIAPMLPEISYVQKCPACGKYYIKDRQEVRYDEDDDPSMPFHAPSFEQGLLTYPEMKEAFAQLSEEGFADNEEEATVRLMLHHAYNDYYYRSDDHKEIKAEDKQQFHDNGIWIINNLITDDELKAEFYREIGEFKLAQDILKSIDEEDPDLKYFIEQIQERLQNNDRKVFKLQWPS